MASNETLLQTLTTLTHSPWDCLSQRIGRPLWVSFLFFSCNFVFIFLPGLLSGYFNMPKSNSSQATTTVSRHPNSDIIAESDTHRSQDNKAIELEPMLTSSNLDSEISENTLSSFSAFPSTPPSEPNLGQILSCLKKLRLIHSLYIWMTLIFSTIGLYMMKQDTFTLEYSCQSWTTVSNVKTNIFLSQLGGGTEMMMHLFGSLHACPTSGYWCSTIYHLLLLINYFSIFSFISTTTVETFRLPLFLQIGTILSLTIKLSSKCKPYCHFPQQNNNNNINNVPSQPNPTLPDNRNDEFRSGTTTTTTTTTTTPKDTGKEEEKAMYIVFWIILLLLAVINVSEVMVRFILSSTVEPGNFELKDAERCRFPVMLHENFTDSMISNTTWQVLSITTNSTFLTALNQITGENATINWTDYRHTMLWPTNQDFQMGHLMDILLIILTAVPFLGIFPFIVVCFLPGGLGPDRHGNRSGGHVSESDLTPEQQRNNRWARQIFTSPWFFLLLTTIPITCWYTQFLGAPQSIYTAEGRIPWSAWNKQMLIFNSDYSLWLEDRYGYFQFLW